MRYLLGIDDTDSRFGHCTTHLGYLIVCELARIGCELVAAELPTPADPEA